jgi:hypothetical protein
MQRGRDAEDAAKQRLQQQKEVSDQQWHLSILHNEGSHRFFVPSYFPALIAHRIGPKVSYESSYAAFDDNDDKDSKLNKGRKCFGSFLGNIDVHSPLDRSGNSSGTN